MSVEIISKKIDVSRETCEKLEQYAALLEKWQPAKNLVANSTLPELWTRHFLDSAQLYPLIRSRLGDRSLSYLDIGSGAGFPGLVLCAMGLGTAHMVESNHKKAIFMGQVARAIDIPAEIHNERIEKLPVFPVDIITSRACATVEKLLDWAAPFLSDHTEMWLLKGALADDELTLAQKSWKMQVEKFDSLTDATGAILRLYQIEKI